VDFYSAIQYVLFVVVVTVLVKPLGGYMKRVFSRQRTVLDRFCLPSGTLPTHSFVFGVLLTICLIIMVALSYLPALALGPVLERLLLGR